MSSNNSWWRRTAQHLSDRLDRLRANLDVLRERLRDSVAQSIGQTVAYAVHDAVQAVLGEPNAHSQRVPYQRPWEQHERSSYWQEPQNAMWQEEPDDRWQDDPEDEPKPATIPDQPPSNKDLGQAVATGCETAAWWLRRWKGRFAIAVAAGLGLVTSVLAWTGGSLTIAALSLAQSIAHLFSFSDTLQASTAVLGSYGRT